MSITVFFRGPMMFVTDDASRPEAQDRVNRILIPDAVKPGKHGDNTKATPHLPGLLVMEPGRPAAHVPIAGRTIEIEQQGGGGPPDVDVEFLKVPPLHHMTNPATVKARPIRHRKDVSPASTITMKGGTMSGMLISKPGDVELTCRKAPAIQGPVCSMPMWQSQAGAVRIRLSATDRHPAETIDLSPNMEVYIYNWDHPFPTKTDLAQTTTAVPAEDDDFKWVYSLLKPESGGWKTWLAGQKRLPAPRAISPAMNPSIGACDGARARGLA